MNKQSPLLLVHVGPSQELTAVTMVMWICHANWPQYTAVVRADAHTSSQLTTVSLTVAEKTITLTCTVKSEDYLHLAHVLELLIITVHKAIPIDIPVSPQNTFIMDDSTMYIACEIPMPMQCELCRKVHMCKYAQFCRIRVKIKVAA